MKFIKKAEKKAPEPQPTPTETEAQRVIARGKRIEKLSTEAAMWRAFASGCNPGRYVGESYMSVGYGMGCPPRLSVRMDEDSASLWRAFANQMAEERERRLKDVLGV